MDFADQVWISISKWTLSTYVVAVQCAMPLWPLLLFWKIPIGWFFVSANQQFRRLSMSSSTVLSGISKVYKVLGPANESGNLIRNIVCNKVI